MPTIEGGHLVARALKAHGVDHLFTLCGGTIESIYDGCLNENIRIIDVRVDHCATMMADAYARVTGELGASAVTRGPGHAAAFYGLATAHMAGSPILAVSGYSNLAQLDMGGSQEYDLVTTVKPVTKWARLVAHTPRIPEYVATAARHALTGRPGPVHLSIPYDVLYDTIEDRGIAVHDAQTTVAAARPQPDPELIERALEMLATAERPAVIAGSAIRWSNAGDALAQFAEANGLPFFADQTGINDITRPHPLYFGRATLRYAAACKELRHADVVLALGCRFDNSLNFGRPPMFSDDARLIAVDADPTTLGFNRSFALGIVADVGAALEQLTAATAHRDFPPKNDWLDRLRTARDAFDAKVAEAARSDATPIHPVRVCAEVREVFGDEATVTHDGGDVAGFALMTSNHHQPPWLLVTGPIGGIGHGVPFILAGKLARPDHPAVLLTGDGSIGYGIMELDTALKHNLPFTAVVLSDSAWGIVRHPQIDRYGLDRAVATDLREVAYHKVAEALGCHAELVTRPADLRPALQRALRANEQRTPALVNVTVPFLSSSAFAPLPA